MAVFLYYKYYKHRGFIEKREIPSKKERRMPVIDQRIHSKEEFARQMQAGCSAVSWETEDGKHLWGRNFDFNKIAADSKITYVPKDTEFYTLGCGLEDTLDTNTRQVSRYAALGMGTMILQSTPALYEGINEKGLAGGQLYYREFAVYPEEKDEGRLSVQPPFLVTYLLAVCAAVEDVVKELRKKIQLLGMPLLGTVPSIHWTFSDRTGESIVIEPDKDGLKIYRNTIGIMTNSPGYEWHRLNLLNYSHIRNLDYEDFELNGEYFSQCFSGSGAAGIPGDWSSPSRFVRLAFLKDFCMKGKNEEEGVTNLFHIFASAAFPMGMVKVTDTGASTELDREVLPYDYTVYTSLMCLESLKFYWISYRNMRVQYVDLRKLLKLSEIRQFEIDLEEDFRSRI